MKIFLFACLFAGRLVGQQLAKAAVERKLNVYIANTYICVAAVMNAPVGRICDALMFCMRNIAGYSA